MKKSGTVDDVAKVKAALMSFTYPGLWNTSGSIRPARRSLTSMSSTSKKAARSA